MPRARTARTPALAPGARVNVHVDAPHRFDTAVYPTYEQNADVLELRGDAALLRGLTRKPSWWPVTAIRHVWGGKGTAEPLIARHAGYGGPGRPLPAAPAAPGGAVQLGLGL